MEKYSSVARTLVSAAPLLIGAPAEVETSLDPAGRSARATNPVVTGGLLCGK